jgi:putative ABC transport system ATP-binding protein
VVGSNGSGKTTLLNLISGAERPTSGRIFINGTDVSSEPEYRRSKWVTRVFQNPFTGTASDLTILDNFRLAALRTKSKKLIIGVNAAFKKKVKDCIAELGMGLEDKINLPMGSLSGGQRQALTLLMSVMDDSGILLLDEPTAALDPRSARLILDLSDRLIKQYGLTAMCITHNLKDAQEFGNRLIQFQGGKIIKDLDQEKKSKLTVLELVNWFE